MFSKPTKHLYTLFILSFMIGGCTTTPPPSPHESLQNAMNKTFQSTGYNYISTTRITNISFPKKEINSTADTENIDSDSENETSNKLSSLYLQKAIDIVRGFSLGINGAVDYSDQIKSEATYDLHYNRDNLEISMKFPFLVDYSSKSIYMGKTFLNTIFPMQPEDEGKLIQFDLNTSALNSLFDENRTILFDATVARNLNNAFKEGTIKGFNDINGSYYSYQPLNNVEKNSGMEQKIHLSLDQNQSIKLILSLTDSLVQKLYSESLITKELYGSYLVISDVKKIVPLMEKSNLQLDFDFGINSNGEIIYTQTLINVSNDNKELAFGLNNTTSLENFNAPKFSLDPKYSGSIDYMKIFDSWKDIFPIKSKNNPLEDIEPELDQNAEQVH
jgi:hypothetical protein